MDATRAIFCEHGLHCTAQRAALFEALIATKRHPTAEQLYREVRPRTQSLSLATVYATLETFCRVGLVRRFPGARGSRFDATTADHVHVRGPGGTLRDVPRELGEQLLHSLPPDIIKKIENKLGVKIDGVDIQLLGRSLP